MENGRTYNRTPNAKEIECCNKRLLAELDIIAPNFIIALGKSSYVALGGTVAIAMRDIVGSHFVFHNKFEVFITYHPAAISYNGGINTDAGKQIRESIKNTLETVLKTNPRDRQLRMI
jgi:uracil-DNA glycosylase family 4